MTAWLDNRNVGVKLIANVIVTLLGLTIVAAVALAGLRAQMWQDRQMRVQVAVGVAEGLANTIDAQVRNGEMTRAEGRARLLKLLQGIKYDRDKYFAAVLDGGTIIVHGGNPPSVGTNDYDKQDVPGHFYMRIALDVAHSHPEGGFYPVNAALPGGAVMKLNFIKVLPAWDFMLVSGLVISDVDKAVYAEAELMALYGVPVMLACVLTALLTRRSIANGLSLLGDAIAQLAQGRLHIRVPGVTRGDEIGVIGRGVEMFRQSMIETERLRQANAQAEAAKRFAEAELALVRERERADEELHIQAVRFGAALGNMSEVLCLFDAADRLVVGNDRLAAILGLRAGSITPGMTFEEMRALPREVSGLPADHRYTIHSLIQRLKAAGRRGSHAQDLPDGRRIAVNYAPMDHDGWLVTLEDMTEQRRSEARIQYMAHHDALTGLANRALFHDRMEEAMARCRRGERFAVLYLDLDHFKAVNDTLGHPVGDDLLREVTQRLKRQVRDVDTVARLGGDEFAIVQSITQPSDSTALAARLIDAISAHYEINGHRVIIGTSVGIAIAPDDGDDVDTIIKNADMALYQSKAGGRGRYQFFEADMDARMQARRILDLDLRKALAEAEFRVFYQPVVNLATRSICGFEALVRWQHPERGMVSPADFIPLAEEIGLVVPLGKWVLRQACADAATWPHHLKVAVNLSPVQFGSHTVVEDVAAALADAGLDARRLELEITETAMLADTDAVLVILHRLRDLGVGIALDDFGTGYSSLSYLQRFPFNKVKIDRSFVARLGQGGDTDTIVAAVVELCARLGMVTTGEGVETTAQLRHLGSLNCVEAQGYLFSPPRPASDVAAMLTHLAQRELADSAA